MPFLGYTAGQLIVTDLAAYDLRYDWATIILRARADGWQYMVPKQGWRGWLARLPWVSRWRRIAVYPSADFTGLDGGLTQSDARYAIPGDAEPDRPSSGAKEEGRACSVGCGGGVSADDSGEAKTCPWCLGSGRHKDCRAPE